ncbi:MAG: hypothetical protein O3C68_01445 [Proteobacteria bacterium]|nr:hypothetical protein [Pseudomonadota bacterium]
MSRLRESGPQGALRDGWTALVNDYGIVCEWALDGQILLVGDATGGIHAFDGKSGAILWVRSECHDGGLLALSVHPEGTFFATAGQDGRVVIWRTLHGDMHNVLTLGTAWVEHLAWSSGGQWLAAACSRYVHVFDSAGQQAWRSEEHPSTVSAVAWSNATEVATACYGRVAFYDVTTEKLQQKLEWKGSFISMVLSPDGDIVACGSQDNSVHFWRRSTAQDSMMSGYSSKPVNLAFDRSGSLLATGGGETVTVWSFAGGGPEGTSPGVLDLHSQPVSSLAFAHQGMRLASGARDGSVVLWALESDGQGGPIGVALMGYAISAIAWRPDGRALATVNAKGDIAVWRVRK